MFRAYDAERERLVAVKLFKLDLPPERVHQLVDEFERLIAADLNHPGFARVLATGISGVSAYLAQDFVMAESLDVAVREYGPAPVGDALRVAAQVAGALDFAAVVKTYHGALHPRDLLLSADETRLTGIGVAQALQKVGVAVPVRRPYTAPERIGDATITTRGDVFSLAAAVFELLTGKRVAGTGDHAVSAIGEVAGADVVMLRQVFARALAEQAADRFETALEFVEQLKAAFVQSAVGSPPSGVGGPPPSLPFDVPEASDRADVEPPVARPAARVADEPAFSEATIPDLRIARGAENAGGAEDADVPKLAGGVEAFAPSRARVWPVLLALLVGIAVGFAAGYGVGGNSIGSRPSAVAGQSSAAPSSGKEFTENAVPVAPNPALSTQHAAPSTPNPESRAPNPEPRTAVPGRLLVRSTPAGARVTVDGKDAGDTPAVVRELATGTHRVHVTRNGYVAADERVLITSARPAQTLTLSLEPERAAVRGTSGGTATGFTGALSIDSRPTGARVFVDGKPMGATPLAMPSIAAGEHAIRLEYDGYRRWTSSVRVVASVQNRVTASLER